MFLTTYTSEHKAQLAASLYIGWDLETTGLTPQSRPIAVGGTAKIGHQTWSEYRRETGSTLNCMVRPRVSTAVLDTGVVLAWDLDQLTADQRAELLRDTIDDKILIGQNLTFDLTWAMSLTGPDLQPALVLDTMLMVRCLRPEMAWAVHDRAAMGDRDAIAFVQDSKSSGSASLAGLSAGAGLGGLDKSYQHPRNWCVSVLSQGHYDYVGGDVHTPIKLVKRILRIEKITFETVLKALKYMEGADGPYQRIYEKVPLCLSKMTTRGIPVCVDTLESIELDRSSKIPAPVEALISEIPDFEPLRERLLSTKPGATAEMKVILGGYATRCGFALEESEDGEPVISSKSATLRGASSLAGWQSWDALQHTKRIISLCSEYRGISVPDKDSIGYRRLRPLLSARTATMRVASETPNVQNLPRPQAGLPDELQFRSAVRAPAGYKIVSADYGQIELRIAAALALRAIADAKNELNVRRGHGYAPVWVVRCLSKGASAQPLNPDAAGFDGLCDSIALAYRNVLRYGAPLAEAFRAGVDPHLLTGLGMAVSQGIVNIGDKTPLEHIKALSKDAQSALKKSISKQRQSAKALNFGLLYGMQAEGLWRLGITDYGLDWTLEEAETARTEWLKMFAEISFWQIWNKYVAIPPKKMAVPALMKDQYTGEIKTEELRLGQSATLAGRPVMAEIARKIGNYSDQGSGADMTLEAITSLPAPYSDMTMNTIHDEVQMLVPEDVAEEAAAVLQKAMLAAADRVLKPWDIPAEADPMISDFWIDAPPGYGFK